MLYRLARPLLFSLDAETSHGLALGALRVRHSLGLRAHIATRPTTVMGLTFPNPVGLAAGLDKNGDYIDALAGLGFGFIEIGTVTPRPQPGNPRPRLFRLPQAEAIINRMGFNNGGVERLVRNVERASYRGILGINIGKNFDTPIDRAVDDYLACLEAVFRHASYVTVNISSPNTKNLRDLQSDAALEELLTRLKNRRDRLAIQYERSVPLVLKIAPDLETAQVQRIAELLLKHQIDGVIATNTTIARDAVAGLPHGEESGGLSGAPLEQRSTAVVAELHQVLRGKIPIIGVGGIRDVAGMHRKLEAGASLIQLYSGLIYRGPSLVTELTADLESEPQRQLHRESMP